ncbi:aminotransferase class I/II-fold pyridoxal phosphate-dependent enzyme [Lactobacillus sp. Sy-1]|uniref:aminotransferase class I/II-fold pyridoxal phosphate-dependent enzyme n=1 Tax=Lactobacillus sp. Sy-1 TaxID=2109645 RepID=UPI001C55A09E|nr:aminotransferase class I/II-fold pyridoxal phosphate-dependent enzyme [Lactobacillus sp. Sy-1]MBW1605230.1 aminotransferase class I/II-fold pyridoxal phosphate-dependent enzyme [Lactobacillus sp. Sy-1]
MPNLSPKLSRVYNQRLDLVKPSGIRSFDKQISSVDGIVKLTIGEPDLNTPEHIKEAAIKAIQDNDTHYSAQPGTIELRNAIHHYLSISRGLEYDPESEIIATIGATEALYATFETILNPGDKVILPTPTFALYEPIVTLLGGEVINVDTSKDNFVLTPEKLSEVLDREGDSVKAVLLNYPSNPIGVEYSESLIKGLADVIKAHNIFVLSDEIYCELTYGVEHHSIAEFIPEQTIYINGVSKSHAMTGWRIGFVAGPHEIVQKITKTHAFMVTCPSDIDQAAATEALQNGLDDPISMRAIYERRRDYISNRLDKMNFKTALPQGAFYIFANIPANLEQDDVKFGLTLAKEAKVGVIPGSAFGPGGEGYIRMSYAASDEDIKTAMDRIEKFLAEQI